MSKKIETQIEQTERKMKEIALKMERLEREYQSVLNDLGLTQEDILKCASNEDHFTQEEQEEILDFENQLDAQLKLELSRVKDPIKTQKTTEERGFIQQHWLFVR